MDVVLNWYWVQNLIKVTRKIKLMHETDLVFDHLWHNNKLLVINGDSPELSQYILNQCVEIL